MMEDGGKGRKEGRRIEEGREELHDCLWKRVGSSNKISYFLIMMRQFNQAESKEIAADMRKADFYFACFSR